MSYLINKLKQSSFAENAIRPFYRAAVYSRRRKQALELLEGVNAQTEKTLWYCGDPRHANLGDIAQKLCILDWAKTFSPLMRLCAFQVSVSNTPEKKQYRI